MITDPDVIKSYLRIDEEEDITMYIEAAEEYYEAAVGRAPSSDRKRSILCICAITQEFYDHRTMISLDPAKDRLTHVIQSMLDQDRLEQIIDDGGDSDEG